MTQGDRAADFVPHAEVSVNRWAGPARQPDLCSAPAIETAPAPSEEKEDSS